MADQRPRPGARGDEAELFRAFNPELMRDTAHALYGTSPDVVEDACSFAWSQFLLHQPDRDRNWRGWLFRTAQREGWKLERERRETTLARPTGEWLDETQEVEDQRDLYAIHERVNDAFSILEQLPPRLQRIAMLRALGLRHSEIGELTGDSKTKVAQLVGRANLEIYDILAQRDHHERESSPRAERLWQLEHEQPKWLVDQLGRLPGRSRKSVSVSTRQRAWRRAALALDDLRELAGPNRSATLSRLDPESLNFGTPTTSLAVRSMRSNTSALTSVGTGSANEGPVLRRPAFKGMDLPELVPIEYRGQLVALVSARRIHFVAPWLWSARRAMRSCASSPTCAFAAERS